MASGKKKKTELNLAGGGPLSLNYLSHCCDRMRLCHISHFGSHLRLCSVRVRKVWRQEREIAGHTVSGVRRQEAER